MPKKWVSEFTINYVNTIIDTYTVSEVQIVWGLLNTGHGVPFRRCVSRHRRRFALAIRGAGYGYRLCWPIINIHKQCLTNKSQFNLQIKLQFVYRLFLPSFFFFTKIIRVFLQKHKNSSLYKITTQSDSSGTDAPSNYRVYGDTDRNSHHPSGHDHQSTWRISRKCIVRVLIDQIKRLILIDFRLLRRVQNGFQVSDPERFVLTTVRGFHRKQNMLPSFTR